MVRNVVSFRLHKRVALMYISTCTVLHSIESKYTSCKANRYTQMTSIKQLQQ